MLYLITGANGAGKTLNTLKWIRERSVKENRPVCHNGRFEPVEGGELSSWQVIDMKTWQDQPDGTIFLVDECHNDFPLRAPSSAPPEYVRMLAEHRRRGFDFYLVTQHPQNIDSFVRRLIGSPGWHRHLKRTFGADLVSCIEWSAVNPNCEKDGSGKSGTVSMVAFPKEVYGWYKSASLHTGKKKIPWRVWLLVLCVLVVPVFMYLAISGVRGNVMKDKQSPTAPVTSGATGLATGPTQAPNAPMSTDEYLKRRMARLVNFPHTAPAYDEITKPIEAPYPAACIESSSVCKCYTQQGTLLQIETGVCRQIVKNGFFMDWETNPKREGSGNGSARPVLTNGPVDRRQEQPEKVVQPRTVPMPEPQPQQPHLITQADLSSALRLRNPAYLGPKPP